MTSAAAAEIEKCKRHVTITVSKKLLYITINFIVMHVVMIEHLIVNRPLVEKIVRRIFLDGVHFFDSFQASSLRRIWGLWPWPYPPLFMGYPTCRLCAVVPVESLEVQSPNVDSRISNNKLLLQPRMGFYQSGELLCLSIESPVISFGG